AAIFPRSLEAMLHDDIVMMSARVRPHTPDKTLYKNPVDPVLLHPAKMKFGGAGVIRAKEISRTTIHVIKRRFIRFRVLGYIRPEIEFAVSIFQRPFGVEMVPATACPIIGGIEPPLIAGHHQCFVRRKTGR